MSPGCRSTLCALVVFLLLPAVGWSKGKVDPVIVVPESAEIERRLQADGVPYEGTFAAALEDARRARGDLVRFVRQELKRANRRDASRWRQILSKERAYVWHCGGFERSGGRYLHCSLVRPRNGEAGLQEPRFPERASGGTDVAQCNFSLAAGQIVTLRWNPEG